MLDLEVNDISDCINKWEDMQIITSDHSSVGCLLRKFDYNYLT